MAPSPHSDDTAMSILSRGALIDVLTDLVDDLDALSFPLRTASVQGASERAQRLTVQVRDHVLPRLTDADTPAVIVVGGSTGAGKSTLVNSILGEEVSDSGVLRPTTRTPVLIVHPEDEQVMRSHPVAQACTCVVSQAIPAGLALIDASDLDSVHEANRDLAARLLEAADLWLFVTTAARYGDHTPWDTLEAAAARRTPIGVVLNRVPRDTLTEIRADLVTRLDGLGLGESPLFIVPDAGPHEGLLTHPVITDIHDWLHLLAGRHRAAGLVRRTGRTLWKQIHDELLVLATDVEEQVDAAAALADKNNADMTHVREEIAQQIDSGDFAVGAPTTRWLTLASAGGPLAALATGGKLRRGLWGRTRVARSTALEELASEARQVLVSRLQAAFLEMSEQTRQRWQDACVTEDVLTQLPAVGDAQSVVEEWRQQLRTSTCPKGLSEQDCAHLLEAAALGVDGARRALSRYGLESELAVVGWLQGRVDSAFDELSGAQQALSLAPRASVTAALRLRAGELTPFIGSGEDQ